jgi:hypothetical protein
MNMTPVAQAVQRQGRGRDTMLVHMTPKEVGGLQALAMQHGGSLTVNPQTGLPEAGFLEAILPTLAGAALTIGSGGVINPYMSAAIVGGIQTARTGDLGQGLLAGLGAYGGAGLGAGLTSAGASAAPSTVAPTAGGVQSALTPAEIAAATGGEAAAVAVPSATTGATAASAVTDPTQQALLKAGLPDAQVVANTGPLATAPVSQAAAAPPLGVDEMAAETAASSTRVLAPPSTTPPTPTIGQNFSQAGQGVKNIFTEPGGFDKFVGEAAVKADPSKGIQAAPATGLGGGFGAAKTAAFAAAPALLATPEYKPPEEEVSNYKGPYKPSARQVSYPDEEKRRQTSEFTYFTPSNPVPYAEGGETSGLSAVGSSISPSEAQVYQNIANVQRLAGIPAIDTSQFAVAPSRGYEQFVYNPIQAGPARGSVGPEIDYGVAPLMSRAEAEAIMRSGLDPEGFRRQRELEGSPGLKAGGSVPTLETGGFVLTKKAVDGLGKGSNKKGQANAQRGLGAIPIKGPGTGTSDSIKTSIDKKRPALVSNGEAYVPKRQVAKKGGAKAFYALMKQAEKAADKRRRA